MIRKSVLALLALAACTTPTPAQVATDAGLISSGLTAAIAAIAAVPGVDQTKLATVNADLLILQKAAAAISVQSNPTLATEIATAVDDLAPIAESLVPGSSYIVVAIEAATALVPVLLNEAGAPATTKAAMTASGAIHGAAPIPVMSADMARGILRYDASAPR